MARCQRRRRGNRRAAREEVSWRERIADIVGSPVTGGRKLGGDLGGATLVELADGRRMVAKQGPLAVREAAMLRAIGETGAPVPALRHVGEGLLLMDFAEPDRVADWQGLARVLQQMHAPQLQHYGWQEDYAFGPVPIHNPRTDSWPEFWARNRLLCHGEKVDASLTARLEALAGRLPDLLPKEPTASLLHGDLWGGNILWTRSGPVLIDPACYFGHREVDVAMLTLFDHPPEEFFEALELDEGWRERLPVYRLWPLLAHLRLFGHSYRASVSKVLDACGV